MHAVDREAASVVAVAEAEEADLEVVAVVDSAVVETVSKIHSMQESDLTSS